MADTEPMPVPAWLTPAVPTGNVDHATERWILGVILLDPSALAVVRPILLTPDGFDDPPNRTVYESMLALDDEGSPIDALTVGRDLTSRGRINTVGGHQYLSDLTDGQPSGAHLESHARALADLAAVRRARRAALEAAQRAATAQRPEDIAAAVEAVGAALEGRDGAAAVDMHAALDRAFTRIEEGAKQRGKLAGVRTGYKDLDRLIGGWRGGKLYVVGARPAVGKSAIAVCFARAAATDGAVLYLSIEMPEAELTDRLLCAEASVDNQRHRDNLLTGDDMAALAEAAERLDRLPIYIHACDALTLSQFRGQVRQAKGRAKRAGTTLRLVIADYLQLMQGEGWAESREKEVAKISKGLKTMSKREDVPIIALAQLNRDASKRKDPRPRIEDLRESGAIEMDADVVALLHRPEMEAGGADDATLKGKAEFIVAKQRGGRTGVIPLHYVGAYTRFHGVAKEAEAA